VIDVVLKPTRDRSVRRRHPWILSGAVDRIDGAVKPGAWVRVLSADGECLGFGHISPESSLRVRILSFGKTPADDGLIVERIRAAVERRAAHPLLADTDALRLVNSRLTVCPVWSPTATETSWSSSSLPRECSCAAS